MILPSALYERRETPAVCGAALFALAAVFVVLVLALGVLP